VHVTLAAFSSLLTSFAKIATVLERLRKFVSSVSARTSRLQCATKATNYRLTQTLEAFSDAIDQEIHVFDNWCATKEADICRAQAGVGSPNVISLLRLENALRDTFSESFPAVSDVLHNVLTQTSRTNEKDFSLLANLPAKAPPSTITCLLLDHLLQTVQTYWSLADVSTCNALMRIFVKAAEPIWAMIGRWLRNGMPLRDSGGRLQVYGDMGINDEFFIEDNEMTLLEAEFWEDGYTLRGKWDYTEDESKYQRTIPAFLEGISEAILASGKAVGLLRALGINPWTDGTLHWRSFHAMLTSSSDRDAISSTITGSSFTPSTDSLTRVVHDELFPQCKVVGSLLIRVILDDCLFWQHLSAIEGIYLMQKGDTMSHYTDVLFARVSSRIHIHRISLDNS
jgi:gamma-tubulin complex component 5